MLTELKAYSSWQSAPTLPLSDTGRAETDLIQIRNIDGLNPVKASVNTSPFGSVDGVAYTGSKVLSRNIVLTVCPNPDWKSWTYESLRRLLYQYFMPKRSVRLVFYSDDMIPVEITGIVEDISVNQFSKDPELLVSIICAYPYFTALDPTIVTGQSIRAGGVITPVHYGGNVESGIYVEVTYVSGANANNLGIQIGNPEISHFTVILADLITASKYVEMSSIPLQKYLQTIDTATGLLTNIYPNVQAGSSWPILEPGANDFSVITDDGVQDWRLVYYERFGGL